MMSTTVARMPDHTSDSANEAIRRRTHEDIARTAAEGPEAIDCRLAELDREWDIERTLEAGWNLAFALFRHSSACGYDPLHGCPTDPEMSSDLRVA